MVIRAYIMLLVAILQGAMTPRQAMAESSAVTLAAVGDIMLAGSATHLLKRLGFDYPFAAIRSVLVDSDIAVGNLEAPITHGGSEFIGKRFRFRTPPAAGQALRNAGFSVLTLANNHILDFGPEGLRHTMDCLGALGIGHCGAGQSLSEARKPLILTVKGRRVAFLAYSLTQPVEFFAGPAQAGTAPAYDSLVATDIRAARREAELVVVSFHWGRELAASPLPAQVRLAHLAVDNGASVVLGHHPHVLQGIERYRRGVIFYSLGNFVFGSRSKHADRSIIARITWDDEVREVEVFPLNVLNREVRYQPTLLSGESGRRLVRTLNLLSAPLGTTVSLQKQRFLVTAQLNGPGGVRKEAADAPSVRGGRSAQGGEASRQRLGNSRSRGKMGSG